MGFFSDFVYDHVNPDARKVNKMIKESKKETERLIRDIERRQSYSDYDNYSNYSDMAERRRRRIEAKNKEIENLKNEINTYKEQKVNEYLQTEQLKKEHGVRISVDAVKRDGDAKMKALEDSVIEQEGRCVAKEIEEIDRIVCKINQILQEG